VPVRGNSIIPRSAEVNLLDRTPPLLPELFARWFAGRGWTPLSISFQFEETADCMISTSPSRMSACDRWPGPRMA